MDLNDRIRIMRRAGMTGQTIAAILDADPADLAANQADPGDPVGVVVPSGGGGGGGGIGGVLGQGENVPVVAPDAVMSEVVRVAPGPVLAVARCQLDLSAAGSSTMLLLVWGPDDDPDNSNPITFDVLDAFREEAGVGMQYASYHLSIPIQPGWKYVATVEGPTLGVSLAEVPLGVVSVPDGPGGGGGGGGSIIGERGPATIFAMADWDGETYTDVDEAILLAVTPTITFSAPFSLNRCWVQFLLPDDINPDVHSIEVLDVNNLTEAGMNISVGATQLIPLPAGARYVVLYDGTSDFAGVTATEYSAG